MASLHIPSLVFSTFPSLMPFSVFTPPAPTFGWPLFCHVYALPPREPPHHFTVTCTLFCHPLLTHIAHHFYTFFMASLHHLSPTVPTPTPQAQPPSPFIIITTLCFFYTFFICKVCTSLTLACLLSHNPCITQAYVCGIPLCHHRRSMTTPSMPPHASSATGGAFLCHHPLPPQCPLLGVFSFHPRFHHPLLPLTTLLTPFWVKKEALSTIS